jgi:hypothetical protein
MESELDLSFHFLLICHLWVMYERSTASIWGLITGRSIFEAFDDSGLAAPVVADDDSDR